MYYRHKIHPCMQIVARLPDFLVHSVGLPHSCLTGQTEIISSVLDTKDRHALAGEYGRRDWNPLQDHALRTTSVPRIPSIHKHIKTTKALPSSTYLGVHPPEQAPQNLTVAS